MIKLAYNKEKENLVFMIDKIEREGVTTTGIIEKYVGTLVDTDNDNAETENYKESVIAFDSYWEEVPTAICNLIDDVKNQNKTVTPTASSQEVTADSGYTGLGTVTVNAAPLETAAVTPTTSEQIVTATSTGKIGLSSVTVAAAPLETAGVTPTTSEQTITATGSGKIGLSSVTVAAVTAAIDANITAENIKKDVTILGVVGSYEG